MSRKILNGNGDSLWMTPEQRSAWLKQNGAPEGMNLVSNDELSTIHKAIAQGNATLRDREQALASIIVELGEYWKTEPDLANAVGAAVFDAKKFKSATLRTINQIGEIHEVLSGHFKTLTEAGANDAMMSDFLRQASRLRDLAKFLEGERDSRRQRIKKG